ncbi:MAG: hypothetical protein K2X03_27480 [Bryobacteraceae bacterium]|nr:hypothetical protein [Bryobacteraceae bacterium]
MHILAIDRAHPATLLAGTRSGRLFRTTNAAGTWSALPLPRFPNTTLHALAIDPADPRRLFAGLNDPTGKNSALWRSDDTGGHWQRVEDLAGRAVLSLAIRDTEPRLFAAGTDRGVYLSEDQGLRWRLISPEGHPEMNGIVSLALDPRQPGTLYAGTTHLPWKTADGGATWTSIHDGMIDDSDVFSILVDATRPGRVYSSACSGIYASKNDGAVWLKAEGIPADNRRTHVIAQDREYPNLLYAGTTAGLWKSADSGATWKKLLGATVNSLAVDPRDGRVMYLATDGGGVLKTMDAGRSWLGRNSGLVNRRVTSITASGTSLYATTMYEGEYGGVFISKSGGRVWTLLADAKRLHGENILKLRARGAELIATTFNGRLVSQDAGKTWAYKPVRTPEPPPGKVRGQTPFEVARSALTPAVRLAATLGGLERSTDSGKSWNRVTKGLPAGFVRAVAFHPRNAGECYAVQYSRLYRSTDAGQTWEFLPGGDSSMLLVSLFVQGSLIYAVSEDQGIHRRQIVQ